MNIIEKINYLPYYKINIKNNNKNTNKTTIIKYNENNFTKYSNAYTSMGKAAVSFHGVVKITPDIIKLICTEYASGKSLQQVALVLSGLGITAHIGHISKLINMQENADEIKKQHIQNNQTKKNIVTQETKEEILKDYTNGMKIKDIAKKHSCSVAVIKRTVYNNQNAENLKNVHLENSPVLKANISSEDIEKMKELYISGFSACQIAKILDFSPSTIMLYLKKLENFNQLQIINAKNNKSKRFIQTEEFKNKVIEDYKKGKTAKKIAKEFGCSDSVVLSLIKGVEDADEIQKLHIDNKQGIAIITDSKLKQIITMYENGKNAKDIAKKIGCSTTTVFRIINTQKNADEIQAKHYENVKRKEYSGKTEITGDMIEKMILLYRSGYSLKYIAKKIQCSDTTVAKYAKGNDNFKEIEKEHIRNNKSKLAIITEDKILLMESLYRAGKTTPEIAVITGCSSTTVSSYLKELPDYNELQAEHLKNYNGLLRILSKEEVEKVLKLYSHGITADKISKMFGCSIKTVLNKINEADNTEIIKQLHEENYLKNKEK